MPQKIKFHSLRLLFQLFSRLADWSGGWRGFASCKLVLGTLLLTLNSTPATADKKKKHKSAIVKRDSVRQIVEPQYKDILCYVGGDVITANEGPVIMDVVETMPEFPGGDKALMEFIAKHIDPSLINKDKKISKIVYYRIAISKDGTIMQTELLRGCGDEYNKDALRVIQLMPRWIPGVQDHQKVNVYYTLVVNYNQKKHEKK